MTLKVAIIQSDLDWENVDRNLELFSRKIKSISKPTDIIVLPEMFTTGFSMDSSALAETMDGKTVLWLKDLAQECNSAITGSIIIKDNGNYYNRLIWAMPDGEIYSYDKRHLFRMAGEHNHFTAGEKRLVVTYKGWRICPLICYDLRFPVWSRNVSENETPAYDCLIYVANWPAVRKKPWIKLLEARAIENQCFVVGVNRVGEDEKGMAYTGNSVVINPKGDIISTVTENAEVSESINLSLTELTDFRSKFPVGLDGDIYNFF